MIESYSLQAMVKSVKKPSIRMGYRYYMEKFNFYLYKSSQGLLITITALLTIIIIIQVICRTFLGFSLEWSEELGRYLLIWLTFVGGSVAFRNNELVGLDLLESKLNFRMNKVLKLVIHVLTLILFTFIIYFGIKATFSHGVVSQISPTMKFSLMYVYLAIPLGFILMTIYLLSAIQAEVRELIERKVKD